MLLTPSVLLLAFACGSCSSDKTPSDSTVPVDTVCAHPSGVGEIGWGDANHDARVDIADTARTLRHLLDEGPPTACLPAMDISYVDDLVDVSDALAPLYLLFVGNSSLPAGSPDCEEVEALEAAPCGRVALSLAGEERREAEQPGGEVTVSVAVQLESPDLSAEGWSFGIVAEGCAFTTVSEADTASADLRLDPAGRRDQGWLRSDLSADRVVSSALLSWANPVSLPARDEPWTLLRVELGATAPDSGCGTCSLRFEDGAPSPGQPVPTMLSVDGRSLPLAGTGLDIEICAP